MDGFDFALLSALRDTNPEARFPVCELERLFPGARVPDRLELLRRDGLLLVYGYHGTEQWSAFITVSGLRALQERVEQERSEAAEHTAQQAKEEARESRRTEDARREWLRVLFTALVTLASVALAALIERLFR